MANKEFGNYNVYHCGKALVNLLDTIDTVETAIGDRSTIQDPFSNEVINHIVSGHQLMGGQPEAHISTNAYTTALDINPKFSGNFDKNIAQIITLYCESIGESPEKISQYIDMISKLNRNRLLIVPFKIGKTFNIDIQLESQHINKDVVLEGIKWTTDRETHKLMCYLLFMSKLSFGGKLNKLEISEYLTSFRMNDIGGQVTEKDKSANQVIKMTHHGLIKPVEFRDKDGQAIIADNTYIYADSNNGTYVIGYWDANGNHKMMNHSATSSKAYKEFTRKAKAISAHRRYIAPYSIYPSNVIEVKK